MRGQFQKGADPRRHVFTREECQAGFQAAIISIATRYPNWTDRGGTHMVKYFLRNSGRLNGARRKVKVSRGK